MRNGGFGAHHAKLEAAAAGYRRRTAGGWGRSLVGIFQFLGILVSRAAGARPSVTVLLLPFFELLACPPVPHPPLGCHFAHIDEHGGAFLWRFPATLADRCGRSSKRKDEFKT